MYCGPQLEIPACDWAGGALGHDLFHGGDDLGVLRRDVGALSWIGGEIVEFHRGLWVLLNFQADSFPAAHANGLAAAGAVIFPVEPGMLLLGAVFEQGGDERETVIFHRSRAGELAKGGEQVPEGADIVAGGAGLDVAGPASDQGSA